VLPQPKVCTSCVCDRPTGGPNMELITDVTFPAPDGTSVTFTCQVGYRSVESGTVACSAGTWSSLNMRCEKFNCGSAGEVINGNVDYSEGTEFGAYARVVCNEGYMVVGHETVHCGSRGWQGRLATCEVIRCDAPNPIANGYFSPVKESYKDSEVITYSCEGQHKLNGSKTATCQENGQFHPAPPKCVLVNCPEPRVDKGMLAGGARPPYGHMSSVTFRCAVGHTMEGRDTVNCDINSKWSPALPKCNRKYNSSHGLTTLYSLKPTWRIGLQSELCHTCCRGFCIWKCVVFCFKALLLNSFPLL
uniref:Sushi domain-containing protein n=1 Tax=Neogobius melanostomus TaxID=47308 RepID=A0A8C6S970_9GOBI